MIQTLIVSDIFGRTEALEILASKAADPVEIVDPYSSDFMEFRNETEAYEYFSNRVGMDTYSQIVKERISADSSPLRLVGFSIGASVIWGISNNDTVRRILGATCFYGSQIRFNIGVKPKFPVKLVFPSVEQHFSVSELIEKLSGSENVTIERTQFLHGFMNIHSKNYDSTGYNYWLHELRKGDN